MEITKNTKLSELNNYPQATEILTEAGLSCGGCCSSNYETIEQGAKSHGMKKKDILSLIKKLNNEVKDSKKSELNHEGIFVTETGAKKIIELAKRAKKSPFLRLGIVSGGCSGFMYSMDLNKKQQGDLEFDSNGVKIFVDKRSIENLKGITVDYIDNFYNSGFKIQNPNAKGSCGCGKSSAF